MKHIRLKILTVIWVVILLLFSLFEIMINTALPLYFEGQAEDALEYEVEYIKGLRNDMENSDDYVGTYFSGEINFIVLDDSSTLTGASESNGYNANQKVFENEVIEFQNKENLEIEKVYTFKTENGYYILVKYEDVFALYGNAVPTIMYINIKPLLQYTRTLDVLLAIAFLCVTAVMSAIGLNLGRKIEQSQEAQRRFFQNSSHELKTPLMAIQGYAEGIQTGVIEPIDSAEVILEESDRMAKLVEEILSISKIDAHRLVLNMAIVDVKEVLYDCLRAVEPIQKEADIKAEVDFSVPPIYVKCDEDQLSRAFTNVIVNAIRHCCGEFSVSCKENGKYCVVKVSDNGDGLSSEDIPHIFDRFYTGKKGNTGIGLALTAEIIKLHRGTITAYNDSYGAVFEIKIPKVSKNG